MLHAYIPSTHRRASCPGCQALNRWDAAVDQVMLAEALRRMDGAN